MPNPEIEFLSGVTATGAQLGSSIQPRASIAPVQPVQCFVNLRLTCTSGTATATVTLETSADNSSWTASVWTMGLSTAASNQSLSDMKNFCGVVQAPFVRANVTAISGTGASVSGTLEFVPPMRV
jgi:hypothetical protein